MFFTAFVSWTPGVVQIIQNRRQNKTNRKPLRKVTNLESKFALSLIGL